MPILIWYQKWSEEAETHEEIMELNYLSARWLRNHILVVSGVFRSAGMLQHWSRWGSYMCEIRTGYRWKESCWLMQPSLHLRKWWTWGVVKMLELEAEFCSTPLIYSRKKIIGTSQPIIRSVNYENQKFYENHKPSVKGFKDFTYPFDWNRAQDLISESRIAKEAYSNL